MSDDALTCPTELELIDYCLGELDGKEAERVEEHFFACPRCARELDSLDRLRRGVVEATQQAQVGSSVSLAFLDQARHDGLRLREYRIPEGETVLCKAGPEDYVVVRLEGPYGGVENLTLYVDFEDLENNTAAPFPERPVFADRVLDEVLVVFPGEVVRSYPRSRWTLRVSGEAVSNDRRTEWGPFTMDHHP